MKYLLFALLGFLPGFLFSQNVDSLSAIKTVDSLMTIAKNFLVAGKFEEGLPFAQQAADISKEKWGENNAQHAAAVHRLAFAYAGLA